MSLRLPNAVPEKDNASASVKVQKGILYKDATQIDRLQGESLIIRWEHDLFTSFIV